MTPENLQELYIQQLRDLYSAESQIIDALPKMVKKASNAQLKRAFEEHLEETRRHKERIEQIFDRMGESPKGETCEATKGLVKEAESFIKDTKRFLGKDAPSEIRDAGLIAQAQRLEHYEISSYGTVATYAERLGRLDDHKLLGQTLSEEKDADGKLNRIAEEIVNPQAERV